jgi:hypothetical protein
MPKSTQQMLLRNGIIAGVVLAVGVLLSISTTETSGSGTWWLLGLAALAWLQGSLLRREIHTSGRLLRLFQAVAYALLGFALVSLLPVSPARLAGDAIVLALIAALFAWPRARRAR